MDELRTPRVLLRPWRDDDLEPFAALNADSRVEHFPATLTRSESDASAERIRTHFDAHGYGLWVVDVDGVFAGFTGLAWSDVTGTRALEVGWRLAQHFWGQGLATEAAVAALAYGLEHEPRVVSFTALSNVRSWRLMERIGMRRERVFDHPRPDLPQRLRSHVLYASP